jgi:3-hydroxy-9,10-secoandrosta-1,3,5(10)-triene-9,17-dione monooxygenase
MSRATALSTDAPCPFMVHAEQEMTARPTEAEIVTRARAMVPLLRERAAATEQLRRLPDDTNRAFADAGFYKIMQPRRYGGYELEFGTQTEIGVELGRACGSSSWVATVICGHAALLGMFPKAAQDDVWGPDPDAAIASSFFAVAPKAERVAGGWRLSGRWKLSSGVDHCSWAILLVPLKLGAGESDAFYVLVPLGECRVEDVWHAVGLAGTGSNDIVAQDVFVPDHRLLDVEITKGGPTPGSAVNDHYLFRMPALAPFTYNLIGCVLGVTRGITETIVDGLAAQKSRRGAPVSANQSIQLRVAESLSEIEAASGLVFRTRDEMVALAKSGAPYPLVERARWRRDAAWATLACGRAVERLFPILGAQGLNADHPVQRLWRDLRAMSHHFGLTWDIQGSVYGAVLFGYPSPDPRL